MANIGEHAQARTVTVDLRPLDTRRAGDEPSVRLLVEDDGIGLDPCRLDRRQEGHLGLRLLADRVETLGGAFTITSSPGAGTRVEVDLPVGRAGGP